MLPVGLEQGSLVLAAQARRAEVPVRAQASLLPPVAVVAAATPAQPSTWLCLASQATTPIAPCTSLPLAAAL